MLEGSNICVLDLETLQSADDCRYCGEPEAVHQTISGGALCRRHRTTEPGSTFTPLGWTNKPALGLSIGCYWDYQDSQFHWFDRATLYATVQRFVMRQPLLVSFNGIGFDFPLMRGLLRREADGLFTTDADTEEGAALVRWCDRFKLLCATSYDILAEIWKVDPQRKFERGLNSLDAISQANGFGAKEMTGALAPQLWAQGRYAEVIQYNVGDVVKTKRLFEKIMVYGLLLRGENEMILMPRPILMLQ